MIEHGRSLKLNVYDFLIEVGITPNQSEYMYWKEAIIYYIENPGTKLNIMYSEVGNKFNMTSEGFRNALRKSLKRVWDKLNKDKQDEIFGYVLDSKPDNEGFLRMAAEKLERDEIIQEIFRPTLNEIPPYDYYDYDYYDEVLYGEM